MRCGTDVGDAVRLYGQAASDRGSMSLSLLKAIDGTVEWLAGIQKDVAGGLDLGNALLRNLQNCERVRPFDPDGNIRNVYLTSESKLKEVILGLRAKRESALRDRRIQGHVDELVSEFDSAIQTLSQFHDLCIAIRWAVAEHDADLEQPIGAAASSAEELLKALKA